MKRGRIFLFLIPLLLIAAGTSYYLYAYNLVSQWDNKIYPNTYVRGINISGKTKDEAKASIENSLNAIYNKKLNIKVGENSYPLNYSFLNPRFNVDKAVDRAYSNGKSGNVFSKMNLINGSQNNNFDLNFTYDEKKINEFVNRVDKAVSKSPVNASLKMTSPGKFTITKEVTGLKFDKEILKKDIISSIMGTEKDNDELIVKVEEFKPSITQDMLKGVNSLISSYSTSYNSNKLERSHNIELAAKQINGALIFPGETFSFNERTGKRDASKGYKTAPIIINNKMEDGLGGGVCQVSTTLYNAVIRCNIKSLSRKNHSLVPAYVKPGFDATVSDSIDYKFKNTFDYPIFIEGSASNGKIQFNIYSDASLNKIKYELVSDVYEKEQAKLNYKNDPNLPKGKIEEDETPHSGYKVRVYLVGKQDGKEISRALVSKDTYKRVDGLIRIGTKI